MLVSYWSRCCLWVWVASSPGPLAPDLSMLHAESVTLKNWEWPGYEARVWVLFRVRRFYSASCNVLASYPGLHGYEASNVQVQQYMQRKTTVCLGRMATRDLPRHNVNII